MLRWFIGALTAALLAFAPTATAATAGPPADYTKTAGLTEPVFTDIVREQVFVPMADGKRLYVEVVRPRGETQRPVILEASPYHGTLADRDGTRILPEPRDDQGRSIGLTGYFAPRGYAVVMMDLRGTGRSTGCLDHGLQILDLSLHGVGQRVRAVAAAAPVVVDNPELARQLLGKRHRLREAPVAERPADEDHRRSLADEVVGDRGAVVRDDSLHRSLPGLVGLHYVKQHRAIYFTRCQARRHTATPNPASGSFELPGARS
jgi:hypothetical protein